MSTDTFGNTTMPAITDNGIVFLSKYTNITDFAQLVIDAYNISIPVRLPERELILQQPNNYSTVGTLSSGTEINPDVANTKTEPNVVMSDSEYLTSVVNQLTMIPIGMVITFMTANTNPITPNVGTSDIQYQKMGNNQWVQVTPYPFNTDIPTDSYNEYNDGFNNI